MDGIDSGEMDSVRSLRILESLCLRWVLSVCRQKVNLVRKLAKWSEALTQNVALWILEYSFLLNFQATFDCELLNLWSWSTETKLLAIYKFVCVRFVLELSVFSPIVCEEGSRNTRQIPQICCVFDIVFSCWSGRRIRGIPKSKSRIVTTVSFCGYSKEDSDRDWNEDSNGESNEVQDRDCRLKTLH